MRGSPPSVLAEQIRTGSAALFPTDTVPALAASTSAVDLLWVLKERSRDKPLILMGADPEELLHCLHCLEQTPLVPWRELMQCYWPGPLTLVLPARGGLVEALNPGGNRLGLRVPAAEAALELLTLTGPIATTSANRSGLAPSLTAEEAHRCFPGVPLLGPLPWVSGSGRASTVVAWSPAAERDSGSPWQVLRQGSLHLDLSFTASSRKCGGA